jgi:8-oxo-dGTP pyrophosphatase MutT (NUDIX family)
MGGDCSNVGRRHVDRELVRPPIVRGRPFSDENGYLKSGTAGMNSPRREVARGLLVDDDHRILLIHWRDPDTGREFFEPPGGHLEPGESHEDALRREVAEETGILDIEIGDVLTELDQSFIFAGVHYDCSERYFLCHLTGTRQTRPTLDAVEDQGIVGTQWFSRADLGARPIEDFEPPGLLALVDRVVNMAESDRGIATEPTI